MQHTRGAHQHDLVQLPKLEQYRVERGFSTRGQWDAPQVDRLLMLRNDLPLYGVLISVLHTASEALAFNAIPTVCRCMNNNAMMMTNSLTRSTPCKATGAID